MSVKIITNVWDESKAEGSALLVMLALADHANDDGVSWPGIDRLAERARIDIRRTQRILNQLIEAGELHILRQRGRGHTNLYLVTLGHTEKTLLRVLTQRFDMALPDAQHLTYDVLARRNGEKVVETPPFSGEKVVVATEKVVAEPEKVVENAEKVVETTIKGGPQTTRTVINRQLTVNEPSEEPRAGATAEAELRNWETAHADLCLRLPRSTYDAWVRDAWLASVAGDAYTICAPSRQAAEMLKARLTPIVTDALARVAGRPVTVTFTSAAAGASAGPAP